MVQLSSDARVTARMPSHIKRTIDEAAALSGSTLSQFLVQSAYEKAKKLISEEKVIRLGREDSKAFVEALERPAEPNEALLSFVREQSDNA